MVQDMFDPEYYMGVYETVDHSNNNRALHLGKYRDVADCTPQQEVDVHSSQTVTAERQTFYCVPVPGEQIWVKAMYKSFCQNRESPSTSYAPCRHKRSYDDDDDDDHSSPASGSAGVLPGARNTAKKQEMESQKKTPVNSSASSAPPDLNFPLPREKGPACLVKVYENWDSFKVNDVVEVFGILTVEPALSVMNDNREQMSSLLDPTDEMDTVEEQRAHSPPTSLVPRIHAIVIHKLQHNNPLLPKYVGESPSCLSSFMSELPYVRSGLQEFLTHFFLGDCLAAEYFICHLISTVYARRDVLPLGKFSLNLSGCPRSVNYTGILSDVVRLLTTASHYLPMTIENMNNLRFIPRKDYTANRLVSGILQLSSNTSLMVDETVLQQGQLDANGVRNVTALGNVITWQKVDYDFSYHQMEFPCNINVLVTSEGRSLLPSDCQVHLQQENIPDDLDNYVINLISSVLPNVMDSWRIYVTRLRMMDYNISEEITKAVEEDFVEMRKDDPQSMSADDLHRLLVVARLLSLSHGHHTLHWDTWCQAKYMETQRKSRLQDQRRFTGNEL
ncbi:mini-chromosome maintenance complex-binding protein isoform X2 [Hyperolius riggenbachi]